MKVHGENKVFETSGNTNSGPFSSGFSSRHCVRNSVSGFDSLCVCVCVLHQLSLASRRNVISPIPPVRFCVSSDIYRFLSYSIQYGYIHRNQSSFSFFKKETWTSIEIRTLAIFTSFRTCSLSSSYFREEKQ